MQNIRKYLSIFRITWINGFSYPASFWVWRLRQMLQLIVAFSMWRAIFGSSNMMFGYEKNQMLTYLFMSNIISWVILSSRTIDVVNIINSGDLSLYLLKPFNFFINWFTRDIADKLQNILFATFELFLMYLMFRPELYIPKHIETVGVVLLTTTLGLMLYFFINMIFGFIGFWSPDSWAPRFLFYTVISFTSGNLYPLDIFPKRFVDIISLTPFPYLMYFQTKVYLEKLSTFEIYKGTLVLFIWIVLTALFMFFMWKKGLKTYSAEGR